MKYHKKLSKSLVVCGPKGSGKTEFCRFASTILYYRHINFGNIMLTNLEKVNIYPKKRSKIGLLFFDRFGIERYTDLVLSYTDNNIILDGIRNAKVIQELKNVTGCNVIFRIGNNGTTSPNFSRSYDGFENELVTIRDIADLIVPWFTNIRDLYRFIEDLFSDNWYNLNQVDLISFGVYAARFVRNA